MAIHSDNHLSLNPLKRVKVILIGYKFSDGTELVCLNPLKRVKVILIDSSGAEADRALGSQSPEAGQGHFDLGWAQDTKNVDMSQSPEAGQGHFDENDMKRTPKKPKSQSPEAGQGHFDSADLVLIHAVQVSIP